VKRETIKSELKDAGWTPAETADGILWIPDDNDYDREERDRLQSWITESTGRWSDEGRGQRNTIKGSPFGSEQWFFKQYHHGGVLADPGDVTYRSPERFLAELKAVLEARGNGLNVPKPRAVYYEEHSDGYLGYYVSSYEDSGKIRTHPLLVGPAKRLPDCIGSGSTTRIITWEIYGSIVKTNCS
jgi:hypothetical protein